MSSRREREKLPLPVIVDLGEALGMPRGPPGSNSMIRLREWMSQQRNDGAAEQRRRAAGEEAPEAVSKTTNAGGDVAVGAARAAASRNNSSDSGPVRESRKRPAKNGNQRVQAQAKRRATASVLTAASRGVALIPSQPPALNVKPAAIMPLVLGTNRSNPGTEMMDHPFYVTPQVGKFSQTGGNASSNSQSTAMEPYHDWRMYNGASPSQYEQSQPAGLDRTQQPNESPARKVSPSDATDATRTAKATYDGSSKPRAIGLNRCVPVIPTPVMCSSPPKEAGPMIDSTRTLVFQDELVNYPENTGHLGYMNDEGTMMRKCVMCGEECRHVLSKKDAPTDVTHVILSYDNGVCTVCTSQVWRVVNSGLEVRRCQECHKWYPWSQFQGAKGMVKTCPKCRSRDRKRDRKLGRGAKQTGWKGSTYSSSHRQKDG